MRIDAQEIKDFIQKISLANSGNLAMITQLLDYIFIYPDGYEFSLNEQKEIFQILVSHPTSDDSYSNLLTTIANHIYVNSSFKRPMEGLAVAEQQNTKRRRQDNAHAWDTTPMELKPPLVEVSPSSLDNLSLMNFRLLPDGTRVGLGVNKTNNEKFLIHTGDELIRVYQLNPSQFPHNSYQLFTLPQSSSYVLLFDTFSSKHYTTDKISILNIESGNEISKFNMAIKNSIPSDNAPKAVLSIIPIDKGQQLLIGCKHNLQLWNIKDPACPVRIAVGHVNAADILNLFPIENQNSPPSDYLAQGIQLLDRGSRFWNLTLLSDTLFLTSAKGPKCLRSKKISVHGSLENGRYLLLSVISGLRILDVSDINNLQFAYGPELIETRTQGKSLITSIAIVPAAKGRYIVTYHQAKKPYCCLWDLNSIKQPKKLSKVFVDAQFDKPQRIFVTPDWDLVTDTNTVIHFPRLEELRRHSLHSLTKLCIFALRENLEARKAAKSDTYPHRLIV